MKLTVPFSCGCILQSPWVLSGYRTIQHLILLPKSFGSFKSSSPGKYSEYILVFIVWTLFFLAAPKNKTLMEPFHSGQVYMINREEVKFCLCIFSYPKWTKICQITSTIITSASEIQVRAKMSPWYFILQHWMPILIPEN